MNITESSRTRNGGKELWSNYQKSMGGKKGQKTDPRQLFPLLVHDVDGPVDWKLVQRVHIKEALPPLGTEEGKAGEAIGLICVERKRGMSGISSGKKLKQRSSN